jgi:NitT/TauT family transport system substrate-binding protein
MKVRIFSLFILITILIAACAPSAPAQEDLPPLRVEFTEWWGDYTIIVAEKKGLFEKHGVEVEAIYYSDFSKALPDLTTNKIDAGLFGITDVINVSNVMEINAVAIYDDGGPSAIVAVPDITSVEDLKGKRIGVSIGTTYEMFVLEMLATAGLSSADVTLMNFRPDQGVDALQQEVDAVFTWEPYTTEAIKDGYNVIFTSDQLANVYPDLITFRSEIVQERPEDVRAFLRAWFEAVDYRSEHPAEANQIIADYFEIPVEELVPDNELHIMTLEDNLSIYSQEATANGQTSIRDVATINAEFLLRIGVLSKMPDLEILFDASYLQ